MCLPSGTYREQLWWRSSRVTVTRGFQCRISVSCVYSTWCVGHIRHNYTFMVSSLFFPSLFTSRPTIRGQFLTIHKVKLHCKHLHACAMHLFPSCCHIHTHINTQTVSIIRRKVSMRHLIISCATNQTKRKTHTGPHPTNSPENFLQQCLRRSGASLGPKLLTLSHSHSPEFGYGWDCGFIRSGSMDDEITNWWLISQFWQCARNCTIALK